VSWKDTLNDRIPLDVAQAKESFAREVCDRVVEADDLLNQAAALLENLHETNEADAEACRMVAKAALPHLAKTVERLQTALKPRGAVAVEV
jgi:hypothetical protein